MQQQQQQQKQEQTPSAFALNLSWLTKGWITADTDAKADAVISELRSTVQRLETQVNTVTKKSAKQQLEREQWYARQLAAFKEEAHSKAVEMNKLRSDYAVLEAELFRVNMLRDTENWNLKQKSKEMMNLAKSLMMGGQEYPTTKEKRQRSDSDEISHVSETSTEEDSVGDDADDECKKQQPKKMVKLEPQADIAAASAEEKLQEIASIKI
jgi:hypothetical protein